MLKSMSKTTKLVTAIIVIAVVIIAGAMYRHNRPNITGETSFSTSTNLPQTLRYNDYFFGVSFNYLSTWKFNRTATVITLGNTDSAGDTITIVEVKGEKVSTESGKFGAVTYTFKDGKVMTTGIPDEKTGTSTPGVAVPLFTLANGWSVYPGTSSWKTDIIAIPGKGFVIIDSGASGYTNTIDPLAQSFGAPVGTGPYDDIK
jgi:hypothetical protein